MSVLAHIVLDGTGLPPEPAATKAFAYILNSDQELARAFVAQVLAQTGVAPFLPGRIEGRFDQDGNRPDLVIHDAADHPRLIVEFKFWARFTDNQPVGYLNLFPEDAKSALLFVVPGQRVESVWGELRRRCEDDGLGLGEEAVGQAMTRVQIGPPDGNRVLAITSWEHVFEGLLQGAGNPGTESDLHQLKGLTEQVTRRLMVSTALIIWWYGPHQGIDAFTAETARGAQLYMAVADGEPCHIGAAADPAVRFDADHPDCDEVFITHAAEGCDLYVGQLVPAPAGAAGLAAAAERAAHALRCVLLDGEVPDGYVSLFSSFYQAELNVEFNDYLSATPLPGFPIIAAFNPSPSPADDGNWTIVRVPRW